MRVIVDAQIYACVMLYTLGVLTQTKFMQVLVKIAKRLNTNVSGEEGEDCIFKLEKMADCVQSWQKGRM